MVNAQSAAFWSRKFIVTVFNREVIKLEFQDFLDREHGKYRTLGNVLW
jgi:hypothetical protein